MHRMSSPTGAGRRGRSRAGRIRGTVAAAACAALLLGHAAAAQTLPERFDATYVLSAQGIDIGETRWTLRPHTGGRYVYESSSEAIGIARLLRDERIHERSEWRLAEGGGVQPLHYSYRRSGGKRDRVVDVEFDWSGGQVRNTLNGHSWSMSLESGMLDKLVYLLELMHDLSGSFQQARYAVADGGKVKTYVMTRVGEARVDTVMGSLDTVIVERRREGDERVTRIWCAPRLRFLPVKVEHLERGETVQLSLKRLQGLTPAP